MSKLSRTKGPYFTIFVLGPLMWSHYPNKGPKINPEAHKTATEAKTTSRGIENSTTYEPSNFLTYTRFVPYTP